MDDSRQAVRRELWELRREPGMLEEARLATKKHLVYYLAAGDPYLAFNYLKDLGNNFPGDREVAIAIRSLGTHVEDDHASTEKRLESAGSALGYEKRHARRLSDAGIEKLASFIIEGMFGAGPIIGITMRQVDRCEFITRVDAYVPLGAKVTTLKVQIGEASEHVGLEMQRREKKPDAIYTVFTSETQVHIVPLVIMQTRLLAVYALTSSPPSFDVNSGVNSEFRVVTKSTRYHCAVHVSRHNR